MEMVFKRLSYQFRHKKIVVPVDDPPSASSVFLLYSQGSMAVIAVVSLLRAWCSSVPHLQLCTFSITGEPHYAI